MQQGIAAQHHFAVAATLKPIAHLRRQWARRAATAQAGAPLPKRHITTLLCASPNGRSLGAHRNLPGGNIAGLAGGGALGCAHHLRIGRQWQQKAGQDQRQQSMP